MIDSNGNDNSRDSSGVRVNNSGGGSIHLSSNREYLVSCTGECIQPKYVFCI